ncbi:hypothetical protein AQPE_3645 [Aquipluma nitroreducens]|uniref:Outer membrane protein beta-barrel domain-containing protein n=1 Tax=Aquipluma nitroreducens TaxID=2010828 RepID=A0A5K7SD14_9BACT|nr:hypothetical protein [Aquipluma nitroreducens]BBE19460.1 hypothetical protein AQPE_3645 [Aquipluma nitroreducens]
MKRSKILIPIIFLLILTGFMAKAQPIPAELMLGDKYGTLKMIVSKNFSQTSKFGIFHINILQFDYLHNSENDLMLQDLVFFEPIKNFRITGGGLYTGKTGFLPTAGMQYKLNKKSLFLLLSPRINFRDSRNEGDIFSILQLTPKINEKLNFVAGIQSLFLFNGDGNIKNMQDLRLGLGFRNTQVGIAAGLEQVGPNYKSFTNFGIFIEQSIF